MTHVLITVLEYEDGGAGAQKLGEGTEQELQRIAEVVPAVSYSGPERVRSARLAIITAAEWQAALEADGAT
jgi:hypothetical protein